MLRNAALLSLVMLLLSVKFAAADAYDDCAQGCVTAHAQCIEGITLYDRTGIQEAQQACANEKQECRDRCHKDDAQATDDATLQRAKDAEEAERKRQEQQNSGEIKTFKFDN